MQHHDNWPRGAPKQGVEYYRPGEVVVLVEAPDNDPGSRSVIEQQEHPNLQTFVQTALGSLDYSVNPESLKTSKDSKPLPVPYPGRKLFLQTVTLMPRPGEETSQRAAITSVIRACTEINERFGRQERRPDAFSISAATPNWLAMPFQW